MMNRRLSYILALALLLPGVAAAAYSLPPNDGYLTDAAGLLNVEQEELLESTLRHASRNDQPKLIMITIPGSDGQELAEIIDEARRIWDLPPESLVFLFSYQDRLSTLQVGTAYADVFTPTVVDGIIAQDIQPAVRDGEYAKALLSLIDSVDQLSSGTKTSDTYLQADGADRPLIIAILYALVGLFALSWVIGTIILFATRYRYPLGGAITGPILGVLLLKKYGLWLSIPPFIILGACFDILVYRFYASRGVLRKAARRQHRRRYHR